MKIALLHYSALPVVGGVESVIAHHAHLMADDGHQVGVIAGRGQQIDERIPFVHVPLADSRHPEVTAIKAELDEGRVPGRLAGVVAGLEAELGRVLVDTDLLIAHNVCSLHKNLALTAALRKLDEDGRAPRLILWHHDLAWATPRYKAELHAGYPWDLLRSAWPGARQVAVSELRQRELAKLQGIRLEQIEVVPNGIDIAQFLKLEAATQALIGQLGLLSAAPLLLLPVRITRRKNIELALRILAALRAQYPAAQMVITGPLGPHNPANANYFELLHGLRRELGLDGSAHFLAEISDQFLPDPVISDFYHLADALLLPSWEEGFGIPILEAGLAGVPVFCSDIPPLRQLGGDYATYFSPAADPGSVANLVARRLARDSNYGLRAAVRRQYTWERVYTERISPLLKA